jgi:hypothetical protein
MRRVLPVLVFSAGPPTLFASNDYGETVYIYA